MKKGPLVDGELLQAESEIGLEFPLEYREFLAATNGGSPDKNNATTKKFRREFVETDNARSSYEDGYRIGSFAIVDAISEWLEDMHNTSQSSLAGLIPVGYVQDSEDLILLGAAGNRASKVYGWYTPENVEGNDSIYLLADGFNEFLDSLQSDRQSGARFASEAGVKKSITSYKHFLEEHKGDPVWIASESRDLAYAYALLGDFSEALTYLKTYFDVMKKEGFAHDYVGEYGACDWDHYIEYLELARQEKAAGTEDWRIRFADRLSFVDPDNNPYPYPG